MVKAFNNMGKSFYEYDINGREKKSMSKIFYISILKLFYDLLITRIVYVYCTIPWFLKLIRIALLSIEI